MRLVTFALILKSILHIVFLNSRQNKSKINYYLKHKKYIIFQFETIYPLVEHKLRTKESMKKVKKYFKYFLVHEYIRLNLSEV